MGSFSFVTGYQHFQSGTLMPVGEKGSIPLLATSGYFWIVPIAVIGHLENRTFRNVQVSRRQERSF